MKSRMGQETMTIGLSLTFKGKVHGAVNWVETRDSIKRSKLLMMLRVRGSFSIRKATDNTWPNFQKGEMRQLRRNSWKNVRLRLPLTIRLAKVLAVSIKIILINSPKMKTYSWGRSKNGLMNKRKIGRSRSKN